MENPFNFTGKTILVTGGGSGIGSAISRRFAGAGGAVCAQYRSSAAEAEKLTADYASGPGKVTAVRADLGEPDEVEGLFRRIDEEFGRLDVLVNNAGIYPVRPLSDMSLPEWKAMIDINLTSPFLCLREAVKRMDAGGAVVNIGSVEAENPAFGHAHYTASKGGLIMFTRAAAKELGPRGIRVNAVSPGLIYKNGLDQAWPDGIAAYLREVPLGRLGTGEDIADACLFLSGAASRWITGVNLRVDGGMVTSRGY